VNTRGLGAIVSGAVIGLGSLSPLGYGGVFAVCAALTVLGLVAIGVAARITNPRTDLPGTESAAEDRSQRHP
jgi:MFS transporter, SET family, sugar efflux transporter